MRIIEEQITKVSVGLDPEVALDLFRDSFNIEKVDDGYHEIDVLSYSLHKQCDQVIKDQPSYSGSDDHLEMKLHHVTEEYRTIDQINRLIRKAQDYSAILAMKALERLEEVRKEVK